MKKSVLAVLLLITMTFGCSTVSTERLIDTVVNKTYNVIFEEAPDVTDNKVYANGLEIGKVLDKDFAANNMVVVKISIENKYDDLMKDNVVFYEDNGRLEYDTLAANGNPLSEGAKILGFTGKTSLYWFKTKSKVKDVSNSAVNKANELYNKAFGE